MWLGQGYARLDRPRVAWHDRAVAMQDHEDPEDGEERGIILPSVSAT